MSKDELEDQILGIKNEVTNIEDGAERKELYIKNKLYKEYSPKFNEIESVLQVEQKKLEDANRDIARIEEGLQNANIDKRGIIARIKEIKKKDYALNKEKTKTLNEKLKAIGKEKNTKMNVVTKKIKVFEKELKSI